MHGCFYRYIHTYKRTCIHVHIHIHTSVYVHVCVYICIHMYVYVYTHTCMYMYVCICLHAYNIMTATSKASRVAQLPAAPPTAALGQGHPCQRPGRALGRAIALVLQRLGQAPVLPHRPSWKAMTPPRLLRVKGLEILKELLTSDGFWKSLDSVVRRLWGSFYK